MNKYTSTVVTLALLIGAASTTSYGEQSQPMGAAQDETSTEQVQQEFKTLDERFSYAYGADLAQRFKEEGINLDVDILTTAMRDVLQGGSMKMPDGEIVATLDLYQKIHSKRKEDERAAIGEKNKKAGEAFLASNAKKEGVTVTESGLQYKIIKEGNGKNKPTENDEVTVHYRGTFIDGTEFDSTHKRNQAYSPKVNQLIQGWSEALQLMSEGAKWELYIPADIAYGEQGSGQYVGPNAVLIFEVELLEIKKSDNT
ncbi:FKBP-type peptidyl-prolyl cis-trans isomerase [Ketobacter sp.]|nr:MAG: FKBP-type peptidyl-prolyl cis-trans isomerase [Ketobacter sp.]